MMKRTLLLVAAAIAVARLASAHEESGASDVVPVLDPLPPALQGVTIQLRHTRAHQLVVENRTQKLLEVLDEAGAPFLRLGPAGAEADLAAPEWYRTLRVADVVLPERAAAGPAWTRIATAPAWGWYDRRIRPERAVVPHLLHDAGMAAAVGRWSIALRLGDVRTAVTGVFRYVPPARGAFRARLVSPSEPLPGVRVEIVAGRVPALYLENAGGEPVVVLGSAGEPFLRIGPDGTSANVRSPTWLASGKAAVTLEPVRADARDEPLWQRQSPSPRYAWIEPRAAAPAADGPPSPGIVREWQLTLRRGTRTVPVRGVVEWAPAQANPTQAASDRAGIPLPATP
jgi:hypothetical protein